MAFSTTLTKICRANEWRENGDSVRIMSVRRMMRATQSVFRMQGLGVCSVVTVSSSGLTPKHNPSSNYSLLFHIWHTTLRGEEEVGCMQTYLAVAR